VLPKAENDRTVYIHKLGGYFVGALNRVKSGVTLNDLRDWKKGEKPHNMKGYCSMSLPPSGGSRTPYKKGNRVNFSHGSELFNLKGNTAPNAVGCWKSVLRERGAKTSPLNSAKKKSYTGNQDGRGTGGPMEGKSRQGGGEKGILPSNWENQTPREKKKNWLTR